MSGGRASSRVSTSDRGSDILGFVRARGRQGSSLPCMGTPPGDGDGSPTPAKEKRKSETEHTLYFFVRKRKKSGRADSSPGELRLLDTHLDSSRNRLDKDKRVTCPSSRSRLGKEKIDDFL
ncbi:hypothetical protein Syun_030765 [Stephania yunnanensis]|uniref:Uncharacterized protein n=1 Tax=Stephania yunnanensis TaxID=152371 RepID=A0AAP0HCG7_9MAGN